MNIIKKNKFFSADYLGNGVISIAALAGELCYLVKGKERALLIDTTTGVGSIKEFIADLVGDLPLDVVITHGHIDHAGNVYEFDKVYIHPDDIAMITKPGFVEGRLRFAEGQQREGKKLDYTDADISKPRDIEFLPLSEGMQFDLGGRVLTTVALPGHTKGSVCFYDEQNGDFFAGDACNSNTLLMLEGSTTIEEYHKALVRVEQDYMDQITRYYCFHGPNPVDPSILTDNRQLCEEIMAGTDDAVIVNFLGREGFLGKRRGDNFGRADGRVGNIMYSKEGIWSK